MRYKFTQFFSPKLGCAFYMGTKPLINICKYKLPDMQPTDLSICWPQVGIKPTASHSENRVTTNCANRPVSNKILIYWYIFQDKFKAETEEINKDEGEKQTVKVWAIIK